jgi:hypothetical protein
MEQKNKYSPGYNQSYNGRYAQKNPSSYSGQNLDNHGSFFSQKYRSPVSKKPKSLKDKLTSKKGLLAVGAFSLILGILLFAGGVAYMNQADDEQAGASEMTRMYVSAVCQNNNQELTGLRYKLSRLRSDGSISHTSDNGYQVPGENGVTLGGTIRVSVQDPSGNWIEKDVSVKQNVQVVVPIDNCGGGLTEHSLTLKAYCMPDGRKEIRKHFWVFFEGENKVFHSGITTTDSATFTYPKSKTAVAYVKVDGREIHIPLNPGSSNEWDNVWELDNCVEDYGTPELSEEEKPIKNNISQVELKAFCMKNGARENEIKKNFTVYYKDSGNVFYRGTTNTNSSLVNVDPNVVLGKTLNAYVIVDGREVHLSVKVDSTNRVDNIWELINCEEDVPGDFGEKSVGSPEPKETDPSSENNSSWVYYWDEECVCTDNKSWKSLREQPSAQDKGRCQGNSSDLQQLCKQVYPGVFESNVITYWDEECVKTDNKTIWVNEPNVSDPAECVGLNDR